MMVSYDSYMYLYTVCAMLGPRLWRLYIHFCIPGFGLSQLIAKLVAQSVCCGFESHPRQFFFENRESYPGCLFALPPLSCICIYITNREIQGCGLSFVLF